MTQRHSHSRDRARRGFTLMELLIVIVIIMVLAGISVAAFGAMARGRALGQAAHLVRATVLRAENYANQYNVSTRIGFHVEQVGNATRHYMILEWYDTSGAVPAWLPTRETNTYLPRRVTFSPLPDTGGLRGPVAPLNFQMEGLVAVNPAPLDGTTASELRFDPDGSLSYWTGSPLGTNNVQVGLLNAGEGDDVEMKAVIVLHASGLPYIQEAYTP